MCNSDCFVIDVSPGDMTRLVCPMCSENVYHKDMVQMCKNNIYDHKICSKCVPNLKKYGFGNGCVYCGDRSEENIIIVPARNPRLNNNINNNTVYITDNRNTWHISINRTDLSGITCLITLGVLLLFTIYLVGVLFFYIGQLVIHWIYNEDHVHSIEYSLKNCVIGYLGWICVMYIILQVALLLDVTYQKICLPCYKKRCLPCYRKISSCLKK